MLNRIRHPSPAMVVAMIALFFALGGAAGAVTAVPLAKRALSADNAKKLSGKTLSQVVDEAAAVPGPVEVSTWTGVAILAVNQEGYWSIPCETGQRAISGGYSTPDAVLALDSYPESESSWRIYLANAGISPAQVTLYVNCVVGDTTVPPARQRTQADVEKHVDVGAILRRLR